MQTLVSEDTVPYPVGWDTYDGRGFTTRDGQYIAVSGERIPPFTNGVLNIETRPAWYASFDMTNGETLPCSELRWCTRINNALFVASHNCLFKYSRISTMYAPLGWIIEGDIPLHVGLAVVRRLVFYVEISYTGTHLMSFPVNETRGVIVLNGMILSVHNSKGITTYDLRRPDRERVTVFRQLSDDLQNHIFSFLMM